MSNGQGQSKVDGFLLVNIYNLPWQTGVSQCPYAQEKKAI